MVASISIYSLHKPRDICFFRRFLKRQVSKIKKCTESNTLAMFWCETNSQPNLLSSTKNWGLYQLDLYNREYQLRKKTGHSWNLSQNNKYFKFSCLIQTVKTVTVVLHCDQTSFPCDHGYQFDALNQTAWWDICRPTARSNVQQLEQKRYYIWYEWYKEVVDS